MARGEDGKLKTCPTCGTQAADAALGLRDFQWVNESLPGKVGGMDLDFCVSQVSTDRMLFLEMKPAKATLSLGARLTLKQLIGKGFDVWVVWDQGNGRVRVGAMDRAGDIPFIEEMTVLRLRSHVKAWWEAGFAEGAA